MDGPGFLKDPCGVDMQAPDVGDCPNDPHRTPMLSKIGGT